MAGNTGASSQPAAAQTAVEAAARVRPNSGIPAKRIFKRGFAPLSAVKRDLAGKRVSVDRTVLESQRGPPFMSSTETIATTGNGLLGWREILGPFWKPILSLLGLFRVRYRRCQPRNFLYRWGYCRSIPWRRPGGHISRPCPRKTDSLIRSGDFEWITFRTPFFHRWTL